MPRVLTRCRSTGSPARVTVSSGRSVGAAGRSAKVRLGSVASASGLSGVCCQASSSRCSCCSAARSAWVQAAASRVRRSASAWRRASPAVWLGVSTALALCGFSRKMRRSRSSK